MTRNISQVFGLLLCLLFLGSCAEQPDHSMHAGEPAIEISNAWAGETPPTMGMNAGYFSITNHGEEAIELVAASSPAYSNIEIHQSVLKDGVASMSMLESVSVKPHQQVLFESGGLHLMMHKPIAVMSAGDSFEVQLLFSSGETVSFQMEIAKVKKIAAGAGGSANDHHHHGM